MISSTKNDQVKMVVELRKKAKASFRRTVRMFFSTVSLSYL